MAAPPQDHTGRTPSSTRGYWARASRFVDGQALRISQGKTISCHANEAVWIWIWIWGQHRGWVRHWRTDQRERAKAGGVKCMGNTCRKERSRENFIEGRDCCLHVSRKGDCCIECGRTKTKWDEKKNKKNRPFQRFGILFFLLLSLLKRFGGLQQRRFA